MSGTSRRAVERARRREHREKQRREALRRLDNGENLHHVARRLGVSAAQVRQWDRDPDTPVPPATEPDWAAVVAVVEGRIPARNVGPRERRAAVQKLTKQGASLAVIADRIGLTPHAVSHHRARARTS